MYFHFSSELSRWRSQEKIRWFFFTLGKRLWIIKPYYGLWRLPQTYVLSAKLGYFHASELFWVVASEETRTRSWEVVTAATIFSVLFLDIWATSLLLHYTRAVEGKQFPIQLTICFSKDFRKHMVHTHCVLSKGNLLCCSTHGLLEMDLNTKEIVTTFGEFKHFQSFTCYRIPLKFWVQSFGPNWIHERISKRQLFYLQINPLGSPSLEGSCLHEARAKTIGKMWWRTKRLIFKSGTSCKTWFVKAVGKPIAWTFLRSEAGVVAPVWPFLTMPGDEGEVLVFACKAQPQMATKSK